MRDGCVTTKQLTVPWEPKGNELLLAQVDDICEKRSALVTKSLRNDGRHSHFFI